MDFIIDTAGDDNLQVKNELVEDENTYNTGGNTTQLILDLFEKKRRELDAQACAEEEVEKKLNTLKIDNLFDEFFEDMQWTNSFLVKKEKKSKTPLFRFEQLDLKTGKLKSNLGGVDVEKEMQNSVLKPGVEKDSSLPEYNPSERTLKKLRKASNIPLLTREYKLRTIAPSPRRTELEDSKFKAVVSYVLILTSINYKGL